MGGWRKAKKWRRKYCKAAALKWSISNVRNKSLFTLQEEGQRDSILEGNTEDKAVLEMAGRGLYSEGFRGDKPTDLEFQN